MSERLSTSMRFVLYDIAEYRRAYPDVERWDWPKRTCLALMRRGLIQATSRGWKLTERGREIAEANNA